MLRAPFLEPAMDGRGFTLVEMLVALALLAVLATAAAPGLRDFLRDCRRTAAVNGLVHAVHTARRLAGLTGLRVELCPTRDGQECSGQLLWDDDLLLRPAAASDLPPRILPAPARAPVLAIRANRSAIAFTPLRPAATTATLTVCDGRGASSALAVIVSRSGRPRVSSRDAGGEPLVCP